MTTGFGGSANTNTSDTNTLQVALIQMQLSAVLPVPGNHEADAVFPYQSNWSNCDAIRKLAMPEAWVRGAMLVRSNSLLRGHSAVRLEVIKALLKLLEHDLVPLVPLRGSISASGDLCPLSYIAGTLEGNPDVQVWSGHHTSRKLIPADEALRSVGLNPISFGPKETLGLLNGTAFSVAVASISQHQADTLAVFAQILTAMGVEALLGTAESFDPFISAIRPHNGQIEVSRNIRYFLRGSKLARKGDEDEFHEGALRQDRYALRTSSQWMGPFLEDMALARQQLEIELNSTTDNPLIDAAKKQVHHGGNFQATAVTSSTEKTRTALEKIGKMIFAQSTELLDMRLNHHLPPDLSADEPSLSYSMKGVDINMAAYMSELAFLANPVSNHVQSAEMSNQAINSLALISSRYTHIAVDIVSLMLSAYLYTLCQALDLRAMNDGFMSRLKPAIKGLTTQELGSLMSKDQLDVLNRSVWSTMMHGLANTTSKDSSDRFTAVATCAQHLVVEALEAAKSDRENGHTNFAVGRAELLSVVTSWTNKAVSISKTIFLDNREKYLASPDAAEYLGSASKRMYGFVRNELKVPMHRGLVDHPTYKNVVGTDSRKKNTGTQISIIYKALREEKLVVPIMECLEEAVKMEDEFAVVASKL